MRWLCLICILHSLFTTTETEFRSARTHSARVLRWYHVLWSQSQWCKYFILISMSIWAFRYICNHVSRCRKLSKPMLCVCISNCEDCGETLQSVCGFNASAHKFSYIILFCICLCNERREWFYLGCHGLSALHIAYEYMNALNNWILGLTLSEQIYDPYLRN